MTLDEKFKSEEGLSQKIETSDPNPKSQYKRVLNRAREIAEKSFEYLSRIRTRLYWRI